MRTYLFALLLGFIISYSCYKAHISTYEEGTYSKGFLFISSSCSCIHGLVARKSDGLEQCRCYWPEEIKECKEDSKCDSTGFFGCINK